MDDESKYFRPSWTMIVGIELVYLLVGAIILFSSWQYFSHTDCPKIVKDLSADGRTYQTAGNTISSLEDGSSLSFEDSSTNQTITLKPPYSISECVKN